MISLQSEYKFEIFDGLGVSTILNWINSKVNQL